MVGAVLLLYTVAIHRHIASVVFCVLVVATLARQPAGASTGDITTVAGNGSSGLSGDGGLATAAQLSFPFGVVADAEGNVFIGDHNNSRIRRMDAATGEITSVVGTTRGFAGDGGPATSAQVDGPVGIDLDAEGNLFIADYNNHRIRRVDADTQVITTVAGTGTPSYNGDGIPAVAAQLSFPFDVDVDGAGNVFVADLSNNRIRRIDAATQVITTVAGTGRAGSGGDGGPAGEAMLNQPQGVTVDHRGNLFIADTENHAVRRVDGITQVISTIETPDASLRAPAETAVDDAGNLFIADTGNNRVLRVDVSTGAVSVVAGGGAGGDGGPATGASLNLPYDVDVTPAGDLLISDTYDHRVRLVEDVAVPGGSTPSTSTSTTSTTTTTPPADPCADPTIVGTEGNDTIVGTAGDDVIAALGGDDFVIGGGGNDTICGGEGNDSLDGRAGDDRIFGGNGADTLAGGPDDDAPDGGNGADDIAGEAGEDTLTGGNGEDKLRGGAGNDVSDGGADNDDITDGDGDDTLVGGDGDDSLRGGEGNDTLDAGAGGDRLLGEAGTDTVVGGDGDDRLNGGAGDDACPGGAGRNSITNCEGSFVSTTP